MPTKKTAPLGTPIVPSKIQKLLFYNQYTALVALAVFLLLAFLTVTGRAESFNLLAYKVIAGQIRPGRTRLMQGISQLGEWYPYTLLIFILLTLPKTRWTWGCPLALTMAISTISNQLLKRILQVSRPEILRLYEASGYSFPSGHTMAATAFACICSHLLGSHLNHKSPGRCLLNLLLLFFPLLMGLSRIYLGVHTLSDVLAAYSLGYLAAFISVKLQVNYGKKNL